MNPSFESLTCPGWTRPELTQVPCPHSSSCDAWLQSSCCSEHLMPNQLAVHWHLQNTTKSSSYYVTLNTPNWQVLQLQSAHKGTLSASGIVADSETLYSRETARVVDARRSVLTSQVRARVLGTLVHVHVTEGTLKSPRWQPIRVWVWTYVFMRFWMIIVRDHV